MAKGGLFGGLKGIDAFSKTMEDVRVRTRSGAIVTLVALAVILTFTTMEFIDYRRVYTDTSITVDKSRGEKLTINLNLTFPRVPCFMLSMDVMDISGEVQRHYSHSMQKVRLSQLGIPIEESRSSEMSNELEKYHTSGEADKTDSVEGTTDGKPRADGHCGSCYGGVPPEGGCCNSCDDVRESYAARGWSFSTPDDIEQCKKEHWTDKLRDHAKEGCNFAGRVRVNKVVGNLHFSPGRGFQTSSRNVYDLVPYLREDGANHDWSHTIHSFEFTADDEYNRVKGKLSKELKTKLGIEKNPLDKTSQRTTNTHYMYQYFLKVVSTEFKTLQNKKVKTMQYSAAHFERDLTKGIADGDQGVNVQHGITGLPGAFFNYEISPMLVIHTDTRQSFAHFLTSTCAIVGGVLTIATLFDGALFAASRSLKGGSANGKLM